MTYMYKNTKTWNPFKGCYYDCVYCKPSFQRQAKRQKNNCMECFEYRPHVHPERINKIPKADLIFCCGNGDINFATESWREKIIRTMQEHPKQTFLLQTKNPMCLMTYLIPSNVIIGTTIETNEDTKDISFAPAPVYRYKWMKELCCRKAVTIEPILDFEPYLLQKWIWEINPEIVWIGYDNHNCGLNEPSLEKTKNLISELEKFTDVRLKTIRGKVI